MNKAPPLPKLHKMDPPFPDMDGKKILVSSSNRSAIGELLTNWRVSEGLFGVRIEFVNPPAHDIDPILGQWATVGHLELDYLLLSKDQIRSIRESDHPDYQFTIAFDGDEISR